MTALPDGGIYNTELFSVLWLTQTRCCDHTTAYWASDTDTKILSLEVMILKHYKNRLRLIAPFHFPSHWSEKDRSPLRMWVLNHSCKLISVLLDLHDPSTCWLNVSTALQELNHQCAYTTIKQASMNKINSIPAKSTTACNAGRAE